MDINQKVKDLSELRKPEKWKEEVLDDVQEFVTGAERGFRAYYVRAKDRQPLPEGQSFVMNVFFDALAGLVVHLVSLYVGKTPGAEAIVIKAIRTKFAQFRADELREKILAGTPAATILKQ